MRLEDVKPKKGSRKKKRRIGRGIAAGQGASGGYGMRGQKTRSGRGTRPGFEGGQMPLYRRVPKLKHFPIIRGHNFIEVNVDKLNGFQEGTRVTKALLLKEGIITSNHAPLKILGGHGYLNVSLIVVASRFTKNAWRKIRAAGGQAEFESDSNQANVLSEKLMVDLERKLHAFLRYPENWDNYGSHPPSKDAFLIGIKVLKIAKSIKFMPTSVVPSVEGGVGITFFVEERYADIECFNSGECIAVTYNKSLSNSTPDTWYIDPDKEDEIVSSLKRIQSFLQTSAKPKRRFFVDLS